MNKETVTLDLLINNSPIELEVPGVGTIKYRMPTRGDRIEATKMAKTYPGWKELEDLEKIEIKTICLAIQVLESPKLTLKRYLEAREDKIEAIIQMVTIDILEKTEALRDQRRNIVNDFLQRMKAKVPEISTGSSSRSPSTGS